MEPETDLVCSIVDNRKGKAAVHQQQGPQLPCVQAFKQGSETVVTAAAGIEQVISPMASAQHRTVLFNDINTPMTVETPMFSGRALLLLRNLPSTPLGAFEGKRRQMVLTVQGRFKQPDVPLDSLVLGSYFARPLNLPASPWISHAVTWLAHKLGGGVSVDVTGKQPHILAPLIAAAQVVHVAQPGQQPDLLTPVEDMRLFDAGLVNTWTGQPLTAKQRRTHFSHAGNRQGRCYDTQHVWTFQTYEHIMDYSTFLLNLPLFRLDMVKLLGGQPLQLMLRDLFSGHSMLHLTVWHKRMLQHPANKTQASTAEDSDCDVACQADIGIGTRM